MPMCSKQIHNILQYTGKLTRNTRNYNVYEADMDAMDSWVCEDETRLHKKSSIQ